MKDQFLKIAGVKSEKEFYKLFPDESTFMAKYGKQLKKLNLGEALNKLTSSNTFGTAVQSLGDVVGGIQQMRDEKQMMLGAKQMKGVSDVALQASMTGPEQVKKIDVRPEDNINTGEEFFPVYGVGTVLAKNGTEIANTFAPNTIYTDLEEAQNGVNFFSKMASFGNQDFLKNPMKAGKEGNSDIYNFASQGGGNLVSQLSAGIAQPKGYGVSGTGRVAGGVGATAGMLIGGPVGSMIKFAGQALGNLIDKKAEKTEDYNTAIQKNMEMMALNQGAQSLQRQNYSYMENGGSQNLQVATSLEGIPLTRLFAPDPTMDTLRTGGNIRQNNMALGGDLRTHWGGYAEPISYNPYLPDGGETIMFRGQSHDESDGRGNTGIGITFGQNPVEVERGEPALKLKDGTDGTENLTVYGNLQIPSFGTELLNDPKSKGKKFKNYVADLSKVEQKQNKIMESAVNSIDNLEVVTPFDTLEQASYKAMIDGSDMKLKSIADKKIKAADLQSAINNTAEEFGLSADDLAKGKIKKAKYGMALEKAQTGANQPKYSVSGKSPGSIDYNPIGIDPEKWKTEEAYVRDWVSEVDQLLSDPAIAMRAIYEAENYTGQDQADVRAAIAKGKTKQEKLDIIKRLSTDKKIGPYHELMKSFSRGLPQVSGEPKKLPLPEIKLDIKKPDAKLPEKAKVEEVDRIGIEDIANQLLPYLRPTDAEPLDPRQLAGEMYALSTNQLMRVQAQLYQPQLDVPYDISLQDMINQNQADYRAAQRMIGYNPAAQANLNAQKYQANQQVLGEQFRLNQAMKDRVYSENRNILNQAQLQNLGILDQQYARQQQAISNTKATTQAALNSITDKYLQNQLQNRTLQTYENLYNYRFDPRFRAMNMNPLAQFDYEYKGAIDETPDKPKPSVAKEDKKAKNGSLVKAIKSMK